MKVKCPYCGKTIEIPESTKVQHYVLCTFCGKHFFPARVGGPDHVPEEREAAFRGGFVRKGQADLGMMHFSFSFPAKEYPDRNPGRERPAGF